MKLLKLGLFQTVAQLETDDWLVAAIILKIRLTHVWVDGAQDCVQITMCPEQTHIAFQGMR